MNLCNHGKNIDDSLKKAEEICVKSNLRFTDLRKKVLTIILQNNEPLKAYDILDRLQKQDPSAKPATIYRSLDFLLENGLIHKLQVSNSFISCPHPLKHKRCYFLVCNKCGEVKECCNENLAQEIEKIGLKNNFKITEVTVEINGICNNCSKKC